MQQKFDQMKANKFIVLFLSAITTMMVYASEPIKWNFKITGDGTESPQLVMTATIPGGYHLFATDNPEGGSNPLEFHFDTKGCKLAGKPVANKKYIKQYSDIFLVDEHYYTGTVSFTQKIKPTSEKFSVGVEIKGQTCNDGGCFPVFASHTFSGKAIVSDKDADNNKDDETTQEPTAEETMTLAADSLQTSSAPADQDTSRWWSSVKEEIRTLESPGEAQTRSIWYIFIAGFIGGLIALLTPCVWPMIPMTVSFFLKQNKNRRKSISMALTYGFSIIVIYLALGIAVTAIFGASALNDLATSAIFNIIFFLLLVVFAISFMGGFEIVLPAKWTNKIDSKVDSTTGILSIFFMAFTLVLVSFSCTGPIIGTLLVEAAASQSFISPAAGMLGFSIALALPFSLFAIFPTMMKAMPKSGGWMNTVKVVLGFLELALALKFLSVADLAYGWRILDREVFVALWIVIFALLGVYLLGKIRFPHDDPSEKTGITRFMLAVISLAFAVYMLPGLWGAPLKSISAFAPPLTTQDFSLYDGEVHAKTSDFEEGMRMARSQGKPVLIDFSGYGCVNCRKMEAAVWTNPEVKSMIDNDFVLITLMVDDKKELPEPIKVAEEDGTVRTLRTVGDKWSYLQRSKFGANAQPYYVILDGDGKPLAPSYSFNEDVDKYKNFLRTGMENYNKK